MVELKDVKEYEVIRDKDGADWINRNGRFFRVRAACAIGMSDFAPADMNMFAPFARLVPEAPVERKTAAVHTKLVDAPVGAVLQDKQGDTWVIDHEGRAWCVLDRLQAGANHMWQPTEAEQFGPFTQLVREAAVEPSAAGWTTDLETELSALLNKHACEKESNTPDFLLADFLVGCLFVYNNTVQERAKWYGRMDKPGQSDPPAAGTTNKE